MPSNLEEGILYVSVEYCTASHQCPCGCGNRIVTPLTPVNWRLIFDGETVSLEPSVGNWSYPCQSHYWIRKNEIVWAEKWSKSKIEKSRQKKYEKENKYFNYGKF
jgi:Family of unknown function (DUF6527)